jgi:cell division protein FtsI/penicillin-binding protein 2
LAAHALGFVSQSDADSGESGRYGAEKFYDDLLTGKTGEAKEDKILSPETGADLALTIDPSIEREAERSLENLIKNYSASGGSVVVMEPQTGKILAMGSFPSFNPNAYADSDLSAFINPVTQKIYEPGSVFKVITMAAGIDAGKITPETIFEDTGKLIVSGRTIQNWDLKAHGKVTMTQVIEQSINTGAAFAQKKVGDAVFREYLDRFGFGEKTGIDLPGEVKGDLRRLVPGAPAVAFATASFGQGVAVTPIEMINAIAAIANGGKLMRPYVNAAEAPRVLRQVISPETARQVTQMMVSAVDKAEVAKIKGYSIAGKTGTAQVPDFARGGYTDKVINTYIGFGPASNPKFIILIKLNEPAGAPLAGLTVVPAFRDLAQFLLNYYNIPPDRIEN